jgi:hypothetical protein
MTQKQMVVYAPEGQVRRVVSDEVRIARMRIRADNNHEMRELAKLALTNPVVELLISAYILIQMRRHGYFNGLTGAFEEAALMAMISGCVGFQQLAPQIPAIAAGGSDVLGALSKAAPGLLALGG